jgi:transcriptional regulator with XRE-family HTH domain
MHKLQRQFAAVLRRRRLEVELSQEALSEEAGLHRTYVGMLENAKNMPSILVAQKIARALGLTTGELLDEVEREPVRAKK